MERWRGLGGTPAGWGRCVVTIGVFDGVHLGHQVIIARTVERARTAGQPAVVLTFDPHPSEVLRPGSHPAVLTGPRRKAELVAQLGVDVLWVLPFTPDLLRTSPATFVHDVLVERLHSSQVVVGEHFRFGHKAAGDVPLLIRLGATFGFTAEGVALVADGTTRYSSTSIRALVAAGDVAGAATALGRPHRLDGVVVRGDARGREIGYPTANLQTEPYAAVPADGIYAGWLRRPHGEVLQAAVSVGSNPTFAGTERRVEAYVLDFDRDIYGERVALEFVARLRGMHRFEDAGALAAQIGADVEATRTALG